MSFDQQPNVTTGRRLNLMSIKYPVSVKQEQGAMYWHIRDSSDRVLCGGLIAEDAIEIAEAMNEYLGGRTKRKKLSEAERLRRTDLTALLAEREDIDHGHHDGLPAGQHVTRIRKA